MVDPLRSMFGLEGRVALVTGGAGGLGRVISETLAQAGALVVIGDLDAERAADVAASLRAQGLAAEGVGLDVSQPGACETCVAGVVSRHARLDVAVANAGISGGPGPATAAGGLQAIERDRWEQVMAINLTGVAETLRAAAPPMQRRGWGRIVVVASASGMRGDAMVSPAYAAAKAGVINLARQAAIELSPEGVMVNILAPGPFVTDIGGGRLRDPEVARDFAATTLSGRVADPAEIAAAALLLASPGASFMAGSVVAVDGGASAW